MSSVTSTLSVPRRSESTAANELSAQSSRFVAQRWARFGGLASSALPRYLLVFFAGIGAVLAWQSYSSAARTTIAGWSPRLAWLAPAAASRGVYQNQIKATSAALAAVHQSVNKLENEIDRLEAQGSSDTAATSSPSRRSRSR